MDEPRPYRLFTRRLQRAGIRYMVTGGVAATIYGEMRYTNDVDIVMELSQAQAEVLRSVFPEDEFYLPPPEVVEIERAREARGQFNIVDPSRGLKADIYLLGKDPFQRWALENTQIVVEGGDELLVAPPEYVIVRKLEYFREGQSDKHLRDIRSILFGLGKDWDRRQLLEFVAKRGLHAEWERVG